MLQIVVKSANNDEKSSIIVICTCDLTFIKCHFSKNSSVAHHSPKSVVAYLFVGLKMKKEEAFGIGFTFVFTWDSRRGRAPTFGLSSSSSSCSSSCSSSSPVALDQNGDLEAAVPNFPPIVDLIRKFQILISVNSVNLQAIINKVFHLQINFQASAYIFKSLAYASIWWVTISYNLEKFLIH